MTYLILACALTLSCPAGAPTVFDGYSRPARCSDARYARIDWREWRCVDHPPGLSREVLEYLSTPR